MTSVATTQEQSNSSVLVPILTIGLLFFLFGFITWLNGALVPFLQIICDLNEIEALLVASCFYIAPAIMAIPMSWILDKTGYQKGMVVGLCIVAVGLLLFVPAAQSRLFGFFLLAQFVVGSGLTILQTASNPFIVLVGPTDSAAVRIAIMGLLNKAAGVLAPLSFTHLVLSNFPDVSKASVALLSDAERETLISGMSNELITPYVGMAVAMVVLAFGLLKAPLPTIQAEASPSDDKQTSILQFPHLVLGAIALFFYVGVEVIAGDTIGLYGSKLGLSNVTSLTAYTMSAMVLGYVLGLVLIPRWINQAQALAGSAILGVTLTLCLVFSSDTSEVISTLLWGWSGVATLPDSVTLIALLGLANALCWPAIWPLALADLGRFTPRGSALLIMGIAGGAIFPLIYGALAEHYDSKQAYALMLVGYILIGWYALIGHKKRTW